MLDHWRVFQYIPFKKKHAWFISLQPINNSEREVHSEFRVDRRPIRILVHDWALASGTSTPNKPWLIHWGGDKSDDLLRNEAWEGTSPSAKVLIQNLGWTIPEVFQYPKCLSFSDFLRGIRKLTSYIPPKKDANNNTLFHVQYPLVNIQKTMENHHVQWVNPRTKSPFSIAFCMFTRGYELWPFALPSGEHTKSNGKWP